MQHHSTQHTPARAPCPPHSGPACREPGLTQTKARPRLRDVACSALLSLVTKGDMAQLGHCKGQPTEPLPEPLTGLTSALKANGGPNQSSVSIAHLHQQ